MWLTPRTASTVKTARGSSTVHTPRAMISFDRKEGVEPNTSWQSHLIRSSRNIAAFKVKGPNNTSSSSSRARRRELWYTKSTVWAWKRNLERGVGGWETEQGRKGEKGWFFYSWDRDQIKWLLLRVITWCLLIRVLVKLMYTASAEIRWKLEWWKL